MGYGHNVLLFGLFGVFVKTNVVKGIVAGYSVGIHKIENVDLEAIFL